MIPAILYGNAAVFGAMTCASITEGHRQVALMSFILGAACAALATVMVMA